MASNINIKVTENVKKQLDEMKLENESYNVLIQRLMRENKELRQDKDTLMKIAMKTPDSIAFPQIAHYVYFASSEVLKDGTSDEEKLSNLKVYLKPSLDKDFAQVLSSIDMFKLEYNVGNDVLRDLSSWIRDTYLTN